MLRVPFAIRSRRSAGHFALLRCEEDYLTSFRMLCSPTLSRREQSRFLSLVRLRAGSISVGLETFLTVTKKPSSFARPDSRGRLSPHNIFYF